MTEHSERPAIELVAVGRVHSPVREPRDMPRGGVVAEVEVFPAYEQGLDSIETNSHLVVIGWFDRADRSRLMASPRPRGVFGIRSAVRPNPLGLDVARLVRRDGRRLVLDRLDFLDGTQVVDIKRYAPGWDCVFSATTSHELAFRPGETDAESLDDMMQEAVKFHGERCAGLAVGARALRHAMAAWRIGPRDPRLTVEVGDDGHVADALQGLTGARFGNGRLRVGAGGRFALTLGDRQFVFRLRPAVPLDADAALTASLEALFTIDSA